MKWKLREYRGYHWLAGQEGHQSTMASLEFLPDKQAFVYTAAPIIGAKANISVTVYVMDMGS